MDIEILSAIILICLMVGILFGWLIWRKSLKKLENKIPEDMKGGEDGEKNKTKEERLNRVKREISEAQGELRRAEGAAGISKDNSNSQGRGGVPILPTEQPNKSERDIEKNWPEFK